MEAIVIKDLEQQEFFIQLFKSEGGKTVVNARDLHKALGVGRDFSTWLKGRIEKYQFVENVDFCRLTTKENQFPKNGEPENQSLAEGMKTAIDYAITMDMAKELSMIENNEIGRKVRKYFIYCESKLHQQLENTINTPQNYIQALERLLESEKEKERLRLEVVEQAKQIEADKPKVELYDVFMNAKESISISSYAKILASNGYNTGEKRLFNSLREEGYLCKTGEDYNSPKQSYIEMGLFEVKEHPWDNGVKSGVGRKTLITPKGQAYLFDKIRSGKFRLLIVN